MRARSPDALADWLVLAGGAGLFLSLFLTWSHQLSPAMLSVLGSSPALQGVPRDPTGWQVYSIADVLLALLAATLVAAALAGSPRFRAGALVGVAVALAFTLHALSVPPTNGVLFLDPAASIPRYLPRSATAGAGETVAIASLGVAIAGLGLAYPRTDVRRPRRPPPRAPR